MRIYRARDNYVALKTSDPVSAKQYLRIYNENVELEKQLKSQRFKNQEQNQIQSDIVDLRIVYVRYAYDWIILTNGSLEAANYIQESCKQFLMGELKLTLSEEKTKVTYITKVPALFLGFSIFRKAYKRYKQVTVVPEKKSIAGVKSAIEANKQVQQHFPHLEDPKL